MQAIATLHQADFVAAALAITTHVTGQVPDFLMDVRDQVEASFARVATSSDIRRALTFFHAQQAILRKVDLVDRSYSDDDARNSLLRALRSPGVGLVHFYHMARTGTDVAFDSYDKLRTFLDQIIPRLHDCLHSTSPRILDAAAATHRLVRLRRRRLLKPTVSNAVGHSRHRTMPPSTPRHVLLYRFVQCQAVAFRIITPRSSILLRLVLDVRRPRAAVDPTQHVRPQDTMVLYPRRLPMLQLRLGRTPLIFLLLLMRLPR